MDEATALNQLSADLLPLAKDFAPYLAGDIRRELLDFVEAPKPSA